MRYFKITCKIVHVKTHSLLYEIAIKISVNISTRLVLVLKVIYSENTLSLISQEHSVSRMKRKFCF